MIAATIATLLASSDSSPTFLLAAGPVAGVGAYYLGFRYYRNTDKSHSFERETRIASQPITGNESKIGENNGTRKSSIDGDNKANHRQRVQRG